MTVPQPLIRLDSVSKKFGSVTAVDGVNLDLAENEFFALLGPSGCGKTTLLRMIAGFAEPDAGRILLDGADLTSVRANRRPVNLMFQSYALFPHMTVSGNVAYGLEMEKLDRSEVRRRVAEVLEMTELTEFAKRKPDRLSGGQRQRVALARALVKKPRVLLLDEPLGALDKQLREQMQLELKRMQDEVGITFVVVTHDQEEALVMADRIAVLEAGRIAQIGAPFELYEQPQSRFVAGFIGKMNFFAGSRRGDGMEIPTHGLLSGTAPAELSDGEPCVAAVRPERVSLFTQAPADTSNALPADIVDIAYHGQDLNVHCRIQATGEKATARVGPADAGKWAPGARVWCGFEPEHTRILPA